MHSRLQPVNHSYLSGGKVTVLERLTDRFWGRSSWSFTSLIKEGLLSLFSFYDSLSAECIYRSNVEVAISLLWVGANLLVLSVEFATPPQRGSDQFLFVSKAEYHYSARSWCARFKGRVLPSFFWATNWTNDNLGSLGCEFTILFETLSCLSSMPLECVAGVHRCVVHRVHRALGHGHRPLICRGCTVPMNRLTIKNLWTLGSSVMRRAEWGSSFY